MPVIPLPSQWIEDEKAVVNGAADYRRMIKAPRPGAGDEVVLFAGIRASTRWVISSVGSRELVVDTTGSRPVAADPVVDITILRGPPQGGEDGLHRREGGPGSGRRG
ncbi:MAG: hypothetical protein IT344_07680 [Candidatus Dadabacteria bacterium]|nr:hypothetical protein [Candidatus Dadabacteria bacterium]